MKANPYQQYLDEEKADFEANYPDSIHHGVMDFSYQVNDFGGKDVGDIVHNADPFADTELFVPIYATPGGSSAGFHVTGGYIVWHHDYVYLLGDGTYMQNASRTGQHENLEQIKDSAAGTVVALDGYTSFASGSDLYLEWITNTDGTMDEAYYTTSAGTVVEYDAAISQTGLFQVKLAAWVGGNFERYWQGGNYPYNAIEIDVTGGSH